MCRMRARLQHAGQAGDTCALLIIPIFLANISREIIITCFFTAVIACYHPASGGGTREAQCPLVPCPPCLSECHQAPQSRAGDLGA